MVQSVRGVPFPLQGDHERERPVSRPQQTSKSLINSKQKIKKRGFLNNVTTQKKMKLQCLAFKIICHNPYQAGVECADGPRRSGQDSPRAGCSMSPHVTRLVATHATSRRLACKSRAPPPLCRNVISTVLRSLYGWSAWQDCIKNIDPWGLIQRRYLFWFCYTRYLCKHFTDFFPPPFVREQIKKKIQIVFSA